MFETMSDRTAKGVSIEVAEEMCKEIAEGIPTLLINRNLHVT